MPWLHLLQISKINIIYFYIPRLFIYSNKLADGKRTARNGRKCGRFKPSICQTSRHAQPLGPWPTSPSEGGSPSVHRPHLHPCQPVRSLRPQGSGTTWLGLIPMSTRGPAYLFRQIDVVSEKNSLDRRGFPGFCYYVHRLPTLPRTPRNGPLSAIGEVEGI